MKRSLLILAAFLSLTGCTTLTTTNDVDAEAASRALADKPVTLTRVDGETQTVWITQVRADEITVQHKDGVHEDVPYAAIRSMEYTRPDRTKSVLLGLGITIAAIALTADAIEDSFPLQ